MSVAGGQEVWLTLNEMVAGVKNELIGGMLNTVNRQRSRPTGNSECRVERLTKKFHDAASYLTWAATYRISVTEGVKETVIEPLSRRLEAQITGVLWWIDRRTDRTGDLSAKYTR